MNDCPSAEIRDLLPDLLHDKLDQATRADVERHLAACADCSAELALLGRVRGALARGPAVDIARIAAAAVAERRAPRARVRVSGSWRAAAGIAAVAIGSLGVVFAAQRAQIDRNGGAEPRMDSALAVQSVAPADGRAAEMGLGFGGGVSDLETSQLETLLSELEHLDTTPLAEPTAVLPAMTGGTE